MRLSWLTDIHHLNFLDPPDPSQFWDKARDGDRRNLT